MSRYIISTIKNAAENVIKNMQIDKHGYIEKTDGIINFDFAVVDKSETKTKDLKKMIQNVYPWYGLKVIYTGFQDTGVELVSNYYGGGSGHYAEIMVGMDKTEAAMIIENMLTDTITDNETLADDCYLLVEVPEDEELQK